jgi:ABC-2 type transport system ATP-binding protein/lipopolysaccharide transport system ATP-binding protein
MPHIRLRNINVSIPVYDSSARRLVRLPNALPGRVGVRNVSHSRGVRIIHVLSNINIDIKDGDRVCLLGHNGAGKTSLLRVLAGIYPPSSGGIDVSGKVVALLGSSISLNEYATGYENIELVSELYNWPKDRMADCIRDIEEFSELGEYLEMPTRIYSAGMAARLAYAMATQQVPDVLLMDEGIGAVDARFKEKAEARTRDFVNRSKIVVLASHSLDLCRAICNRALLLSNGQQEYFGDIEEAIKRYLAVTPAQPQRSRQASSIKTPQI